MEKARSPGSPERACHPSGMFGSSAFFTIGKDVSVRSRGRKIPATGEAAAERDVRVLVGWSVSSLSEGTLGLLAEGLELGLVSCPKDIRGC